MKKILLNIFPLLLCFTSSVGLAQDWHWGKRAQNRTEEIAVDNNGNIYVLWIVGDFANVDGHSIPTHGFYGDIGITSFRCDGTYRWTKVIGTDASDGAFGLAADTLGGIYILGHLGNDSVSNVYIDDDAVLPPSWKRILLVKYDTAGNFQWQRMPEADMSHPFDPYYFTAGFNMSVEPDGNIHVLSVLEPGTYAEGAYTATYPNNDNIYALKYDKNGAFTGGVHFDIQRDSLLGIAPFGFTMIYDPVSDHYYWAGARNPTDPIAFAGDPVTGYNFLACFDKSGDVLWVQKSNNDGIPTNIIGKPAIDPAGNIYVTGTSYNEYLSTGATTDGFGPFDFHNTMGLWGFPFLVKFDSSGNVLYATNASGMTDNAGGAVSYRNGVIGVGCIYAGGAFDWQDRPLGVNNQYYNSFIARFNAATGSLIGYDTLYSEPMVDEYVTVLSSDKKGNFYLGGDYTGNIIIAGTSMNKKDGTTDGYIAKSGSTLCHCDAPDAAFSHSGTELTHSFTYTGSAADSVLWSFGDGTIGTGAGITHTYADEGIYTICAVAYNECGSTEVCTVLNTDDGMGIAEGAGGFEEVRFYPNPVKDVLFISGLKARTHFSIYDLVGKRVLKGTLAAGDQELLIDNLSAGGYIMQLHDNEGLSGHFKFIVR